MNSIYKVPVSPLTSRFVAPWDTSGWYYLRQNFGDGVSIYSNTGDRVISADEKFYGGDYVVTYNSNAEGFDDKQEIVFFAQRDVTVSVALPVSTDGSFLRGYAKTDDIIKTTCGDYAVYSRGYKDGEYICVPGFSGAGNHFFAIITPASADEDTADIPEYPFTPSREDYIPRKYGYYIHEAFPEEENRRSFDMDLSGDIVLHIGLIIPAERTEVDIQGMGKMLFQNKDALILGRPGFYVPDRINELTFTISDGKCEISANRFLCARLPFENHIGNISLSGGCLRFVYAFDRTDKYVFAKDFGNAYMTVKDYEQFDIPSVSGVFTAECDLKPLGEGFSACTLAGNNGETIARVAFYKNNLYASDGEKLIRITGGNNDFAYYPCDNRYFIRISGDTETGKYSLWVDGALRAGDFSFAQKADKFSCVSFSSVSAYAEVRFVRVYDAYDFTRGVLPSGEIKDVRDFGAKGDGVTYDTPAIQRAIDSLAPGGTVYIGKGTYLSGEIKLKSDMTLYIARGAVIKGVTDHSCYPLREPRTSLCAHRQLGRGLIYAEGVENVLITGGGELDGSGTYRFKMNDPAGDRRNEDARPDIIYITYSSCITISNLRLRNSAFWTVVPLSSNNITIKNLDLDCLNTPNRDGIDPVDCSYIRIEDCRIMAGDDGLCFKSSDDYGCSVILARRLYIQSLASGIKFGTDTYYELTKADFSDISIKNVNRCGISLETVDGALVNNVVFHNIDMTDVGAPVYITVGARNRLPRGLSRSGEPFPVRTGKIRSVRFINIRFAHPYPFSYTKDIREIMAIGQSDNQRIENVTFSKCDFALPGGFTEIPAPPVTIDNKYPEYDRHGLSSGHAFTIKYAKNFIVEDCKITLDSPDERPMIGVFDYEE